MKVVGKFPPNIAEIERVFSVRGKGVIFAYGDRIYNPEGITIPPQLLVHEAVHGERQGGTAESIEDWWRRYIADRQFRLDEELPAHVAEYRYLLEHGNRKERRRAKKIVSERLSGDFYGRLLSRKAAEALLG